MSILKRIVSEAVSSSESRQLLILGAGVDVSYEREYETKCRVFSVDLPEVISIRPPPGSANSAVITADLANCSTLLSKLGDAGLDVVAPVVIILECVLCYIPEQSVRSLLASLSNVLTQSVAIMYDPLFGVERHSSSGFLAMMLRKFDSRGAPILFSPANTTDYSVFLRSCGWKHVHSMSVSQAMCSLATAKDVQEQKFLGLFDEYASLALLNGHYNVTIVSSSPRIFNKLISGLWVVKFSPERLVSSLSARIASLSNRLDSFCIAQNVQKDQSRR